LRRQRQRNHRHPSSTLAAKMKSLAIRFGATKTKSLENHGERFESFAAVACERRPPYR